VAPATTIAHALGRPGALDRLRALAQDHGIELDFEPDGASGVAAKETPLGTARARFAVGENTISVQVLERPAFMPEAMIQRALAESLERAFGASAGA
jgi:fructose-specific phosphotransferase system component IIB